MENKYNNNKFWNNYKIQFPKYSEIRKYNFHLNQNNDIDNILKTDNNLNSNNIVENIINNQNINNDSFKINSKKELSFLKTNKSSNIYEKNIEMLNEKIKEQENDIFYLSNRLKNYDATIEEVTRLNIEINKLNEIIKEKNYTIQEFKEITELSKRKFDDLLKNKRDLIQIIKKLEKENKELKKNINNFDDNFNNMKKDLDYIIKENRELKKELYGKNKKIKNINDIIERVSNNKNNNNFNKISNINKKYEDINFNEDIPEKENSNNNYYRKMDDKCNLLKERSKTPLLNKFNNEEYDLPFQRFNNFRQYFSMRTEPNEDTYNDLKPSFNY